MLLLVLLLASSSAQTPLTSEEVSTPASLLRPKNFNHHAYLPKYLDNNVKPTKQGPVLFPNDAPPPPRPPLIVTSRPLIESIARSELNPTPPEVNNSIAESTQVQSEFRLRPDYVQNGFNYNQYGYVQSYPGELDRPGFKLKPDYLARVKDYRPFTLTTPTHVFGLYEKKRLEDYDEEPPVLPPIYKAIADHAQQKALKLQKKQKNLPHSDYQNKDLDYTRRYQHNDVRDDEDYDHASNYAFSYTVKDRDTGDDFSHTQQSSGSATNGEYRVRLPDGRMQIVSYTADENGYKANVRYDDEDKTAGNSIDYNQDYEKNKHDYAANARNHASNVRDYAANARNYVSNALDYAANARDYAANARDYAANQRAYEAQPIYASNNYDRVNENYVQNRNIAPKSTPAPVKEDYNQYTDNSKEYYNTDYSLEYDGKDDNYAPHKSKFTSFAPKGSNLGTIVVPGEENQNFISSTVKPSYEELKPLFVERNLYNNAQPTQNYLKNIEINVPSTTPNPLNYDGTTEHVVIIGRKNPNLYTNVRNLAFTVTPSPVTTPNSFVTPRNYLVSTIASLKNGQKPILSGSFIDRVNKYLTFT